MRIIAVDDEKLALESLVSAISEALPEEMPMAFRKGNEALEMIRQTGCDIAFLDIRMRNISGLALAKQIKEIAPHANIIFATGYSEYSLEAFRLYASDYLLKPVTPEQIRTAMQNLRNPVKVSERRISIQEVSDAYDAGKLQEVFGTGTAAVISPVGHLKWGDKVMEINGNKIGEISQKLYDTMTGMQYGKLADEMGWIVKLKG